MNTKNVYEQIEAWIEKYKDFQPDEISELQNVIAGSVELLSEKEAKEMLLVHLMDYVLRNYWFPVKNIMDKIKETQKQKPDEL